MRINLKEEKITLENLKALIESGSDEENNQLRCDKNGNLFLSQEVGNSNLENILFRFETFQAGNSYVGLKAAQDLKYLNLLLRAIEKNWPKPEHDGYIDSF